MKKNLKILCLSLLLVLVGVVASPQKVQAGPLVCTVNGQYHVPNRSTTMTYLVKVQVNGTIYNGTLWTCDCGSQVITSDVSRYCYPSDCSIGYSAGYPYLPYSYSYYIPSTTYAGVPSTWYNIH